MAKKAQVWCFTVTDRRGSVQATITIQAKRDVDMFAALAKLKAPFAVARLVRHNGLGVVRRFNWDTPTGRVTGVRI